MMNPINRIFPAGLTRRPRLARAALGLLALAVMLVLGAGLYGCASHARLEREIAETPRDPATGVVLGAEALSLTPPGADRPTSACLLLHGFVGSRQDFAELGPRLAEAGYHVRMTRLPGHGTTPREFARLGPEVFTEHVEAEYRRLRADFAEVNVIGFSMGGALATLLAAEAEPDRLVLVAPYFGVTYRWYYVLPAEWWNTLLGPLAPYVIKLDGFVRVNRPEAKGRIYSYGVVPTRGAATLMRLGRLARRPEALGAISAPTLMLMSRGDEAASPERARAAFEQIGAVEKQVVWFTDRSNHILLWDYDREPATQAILDFLRRTGH